MTAQVLSSHSSVIWVRIPMTYNKNYPCQLRQGVLMQQKEGNGLFRSPFCLLALHKPTTYITLNIRKPFKEQIGRSPVNLDSISVSSGAGLSSICLPDIKHLVYLVDCAIFPRKRLGTHVTIHIKFDYNANVDFIEIVHLIIPIHI